MFYGDFQEPSNDCDPVELSYPAPVLQAVVSYCYTNLTDFECYFADREKDKDENFHQSDSSAMVLVQLRDAANYLELSELLESISELFRDRPQFEYSICAILQELMIRGDFDGEIWNACVEEIEWNPEGRLMSYSSKNAGIRGTSLPLLEIIVQYLVDHGEKADSSECTYVTINALQAWNDAHDSATEEEQSKLRKLAESLDFDFIDSGDFDLLTPCSLFPIDRYFFPRLEGFKTYPYVAVKLLKLWNTASGSASEEERSKLQNFADEIDLESMRQNELLTIKTYRLLQRHNPCLFTVHFWEFSTPFLSISWW